LSSDRAGEGSLLFYCFTGLAFVDVASLNNEDIVDNEGSKWIKKRRQNMTKKYARVVDGLIKKDMQKIAGKYDSDVKLN